MSGASSPLPRIDPRRDQLDALLLADEGKPARERLTPIRIFKACEIIETGNAESWRFRLPIATPVRL